MQDATDSSARASKQTWFGVPRTAATEVVVFFAVALLVDALLLDGTRFRDVQPHPFWLFLLVVAAHYGTETGVLAALLATLLAFAGNLPARDPFVTQTAYLVTVLSTPVLWFASAVVLGELRKRHQRRHLDLRRRLAESRDEKSALEVTNEALKLANERLGKHSAGQVETHLSLVRAAGTVDTDDTNAVFQSVGALITSLLSPDAYAIYLVDGGHLKLVAQKGDGKSAPPRERYNEGDVLFDAVVRDGEVVHVASEAGRLALGDEGVIAGPLVDGARKQVVGMLKIGSMPLANLGPRSLQAFAVLTEWISAAYRNAQVVEQARKSRIIHGQSHLFTDAYYQSISKFVLAMAMRADFELTQMTVRLRDDGATPSVHNTAVNDAIAATVLKGLRDTDLAFDYTDERGDYVVLLPMTPMENTPVLATRLRSLIERAAGGKDAAGHVSVTFECLHMPAAKRFSTGGRSPLRRTDPYSLVL